MESEEIESKTSELQVGPSAWLPSDSISIGMSVETGRGTFLRGHAVQRIIYPSVPVTIDDYSFGDSQLADTLKPAPEGILRVIASGNRTVRMKTKHRMHHMPRLLSLVVLSVAYLNLPGTSSAQEQLEAINATSKAITILDGDDKLTGLIVPELELDVYVYHPTLRPKTVSIVTDVDRLDVTVEPGKSYDFTILFDGKRCRQRLSPVHPDGVVYRSKQVGSSADSIPFTLGPNHAIQFKGSINKSQQLDLIFDTGASICVLSEEGRAKGARIVQGPKNEIELAGMTISNSDMVYIDYRGNLHADGVVGYNAFPGKVVHIDYERGLFSVSDQLPELDGYVKSELHWRGAGTFLPITLHHRNSSSTTLALFDTGSKWSLSLTDDDAFSRENYLTVDKLGWRTGVMVDGTRISSKVFKLDRLFIAGLAFNHVQAELEEPSNRPGLTFNILGNDFLRRFNLAIDYRESVVYLRPNAFANESYNSIFDLNSTIVLGFLTLGVVISGLAYWRPRPKRSVKSLETLELKKPMDRSEESAAS